MLHGWRLGPRRGADVVDGAHPELVAAVEGTARPLGRRRRPSSLSLFEWARGAEEEREKEPVGAGR